METISLSDAQNGISHVNLPNDPILPDHDVPAWLRHQDQTVIAFTHETHIENVIKIRIIAQHFEAEEGSDIASAGFYRIQSIVPGSGRLIVYDRVDWQGVQNVCNSIKQDLNPLEDDHTYAFETEINEHISVFASVSREQLDTFEQIGIEYYISVGIAHSDHDLPNFIQVVLLQLTEGDEKEAIDSINTMKYTKAVVQWPIDVRLRMAFALDEFSYYADGNRPDIDMSKYEARSFLAKFPQVRNIFDHEPDVVAKWFR